MIEESRLFSPARIIPEETKEEAKEGRKEGKEEKKGEEKRREERNVREGGGKRRKTKTKRRKGSATSGFARAATRTPDDRGRKNMRGETE